MFLPSLGRKQDHNTTPQQRAGATTRRIGYKGGWSIDRAIQDGYERVMWVFRCVDAIASSAANLPVSIRDGDRDHGTPLGQEEEEQLYFLLNRWPNPFESALQFRYRLSSQVMLSNRGAFIEKVFRNDGGIHSLYLLPPSRVEPQASDDTFVESFRVHVDQGKHTDLEPERVLWVRKPHPTRPLAAVTPLESLGLTVDLDFYARLYNRNFLQRDGRPGGLVAVQGGLSREDREELERRFSGGPGQAGRTSVLEAEDLSYVDTSTTPRDAQYVESRNITKEEILLGFGTPESVLGNASGRTYDNADAEFGVFWRVTMLPHLNFIGSGLDTLTSDGQGFDDDRFVAHDTSDVNPLQRDRRVHLDAMRRDLSAGLITLDEFREAAGLEPFNVPESRVLWMPRPNAVAVGAEQDMATITLSRAQRFLSGEPEPSGDEPTSPTGPVPIDGEAGSESLTASVVDVKQEALPPGKAPLRVAVRVDDPSRAQLKQAHDLRVERWETNLTDVVVDIFDRQGRVILERLKGEKARRGTRHYRPAGTKQLAGEQITQPDRWRTDGVSAATDVIRRLVTDTSSQMLEEFGAGDTGEAVDELMTVAGSSVTASYAAVVGDSVADYAAKTAERIEQLDAVEGADHAMIVNEVEKRYADSTKRSNAIATTTVTGALNSSTEAAAGWISENAAELGLTSMSALAAAGLTDEAGGVMLKEWLSMRDELVRMTHAEVDGQVRERGQSFAVGGAELQFPGADGPPEEVRHCRCVLVWWTLAEALAEGVVDEGEWRASRPELFE